MQIIKVEQLALSGGLWFAAYLFIIGIQDLDYNMTEVFI